MATQQSIVPGSRIEIRDDEWLVRRIERTARAGNVIYAIGL
jgi:hypothetical protein